MAYSRRRRPKGRGRYTTYANNQRGRTVYIGQTNNPRRRAAQHRKAGKGQLKVIARHPTRRAAKQHERNLLARYRRMNGGRNPKYNKTWDG